MGWYERKHGYPFFGGYTEQSDGSKRPLTLVEKLWGYPLAALLLIVLFPWLITAERRLKREGY